MTTSLLLIGAGKMGGAMLTGWLADCAAPGGVTVVEPDSATREAWAERAGVVCHANVDDVAETYRPTMVVLAVKPQTMATALPALRRFAGPDTAFLSIAAGTTLAVFQRYLGDRAAIIRAMPNTPAAVGRGISAYCGNAAASDAQKDLAARLLGAVGAVVALDDESQMDAWPLFQAVGQLMSSIPKLWRRLASPPACPPIWRRDWPARRFRRRQVARLSDEDASQLRINVTSPGGTTQAALEVLMDGETGLRPWWHARSPPPRRAPPPWPNNWAAAGKCGKAPILKHEWGRRYWSGRGRRFVRGGFELAAEGGWRRPHGRYRRSSGRVGGPGEPAVKFQ